MNKKHLESFFKLSEEEQKDLVKAHKKREEVLSRMQYWKTESDKLTKELNNIRTLCQHPLVNEHKQWNSDEFGKMLSQGWIDYTCPDCGSRWTETFTE